MDAKQIRGKHKRFLFPSVMNYYEEPLVVESASGLRVQDADGRSYLDFFGGILTVSVSHCHPEITERVGAQLRRLQHTSTLYPTEPMVDLAETDDSTIMEKLDIHTKAGLIKYALKMGMVQL